MTLPADTQPDNGRLRVAPEKGLLHLVRVANARIKDGLYALAAQPLARAFSLSLAAHLSIYAFWWLGQSVDLWSRIPIFDFLRAAEEKKAQLEQQMTSNQRSRAVEVPLVFLEVDPSLAAKEAPEDAKFYSAVSTVASNPKPADTDSPSIEGTQKDFLKVTPNRPLRAKPLEPTPSQAEELSKASELASKPRPEPKPVGDLALAKPQDKKSVASENQSTTTKGAERSAKPRPLKLDEVQAGSPGAKSQADGGVRKHDLTSSFAARGTIVGDYDWRFVEAVRQRWYTLLDQVAATSPGKVVLEFRIHYDG